MFESVHTDDLNSCCFVAIQLTFVLLLQMIFSDLFLFSFILKAMYLNLSVKVLLIWMSIWPSFWHSYTSRDILIALFTFVIHNKLIVWWDISLFLVWDGIFGGGILYPNYFHCCLIYKLIDKYKESQGLEKSLQMGIIIQECKTGFHKSWCNKENIGFI